MGRGRDERKVEEKFVGSGRVEEGREGVDGTRDGQRVDWEEEERWDG